MKKILTVVFSLSKGGTERAAQVFAEAYQEIGHDSRLLSLYGLGPRYDEIKDRIKVWNGISDNNLEEIKEWMPDIIHIHSHGPKEEDINKLLNIFKNNDVKIIEQNVFSLPSPWAKRVDISFQLSNWALWLFNLRGGDKFKSSVIPYPVVCDNFYPKNKEDIKKFRNNLNIPEDAFVLGRIGQSCSGKWSIILIDSFNKLAKVHQNMFLVVVNPPENILRKINKSPFKERIIYIPAIYGDDNLAIAYSSFDLMIHTAEIGESFGYVLAESILCGTPVVTLSTPWGDNSQCEVVGNLRGGYVVNSLKGIIKAVEHFMRIDNKDEIKISGRDYILKEYNYLEVANRAIDSLSRVDCSLEGIKLSDKINFIAKNTFDKTNFLTIFLIKANSLFLRKLTAYQYPIRILFQKIFKKLFCKSII